jgi:hypothetical protein
MARLPARPFRGEMDGGRSRFRRIDPQAGGQCEPAGIPARCGWRGSYSRAGASSHRDCPVGSLPRRSERVQWRLLQRVREMRICWPAREFSRQSLRLHLPGRTYVPVRRVSLPGRRALVRRRLLYWRRHVCKQHVRLPAGHGERLSRPQNWTQSKTERTPCNYLLLDMREVHEGGMHIQLSSR